MQGPTLSQVKYQIVRLMRMLVEVTNTLEQVHGCSAACRTTDLCSVELACCSRTVLCRVGALAADLPVRLINSCQVCAPVKVPDERYLFMKMTYTDDTPEEYEPPMFGPAPDGGVGCFSRMPFIM